jgi:hypothetical protein
MDLAEGRSPSPSARISWAERECRSSTRCACDTSRACSSLQTRRFQSFLCRPRKRSFWPAPSVPSRQSAAIGSGRTCCRFFGCFDAPGEVASLSAATRPPVTSAEGAIFFLDKSPKLAQIRSARSRQRVPTGQQARFFLLYKWPESGQAGCQIYTFRDLWCSVRPKF